MTTQVVSAGVADREPVAKNDRPMMANEVVRASRVFWIRRNVFSSAF